MGVELMAESSISSMHKLATTGLTGLPIAQPSFHDTLNSIDPHISFTIEHENNCQISFLDTLVSRDNGKLIINVTLTDTWIFIPIMTRITKSVLLRHLYIEPQFIYPTPIREETKKSNESTPHWNLMGNPLNLIADIERKKRVPPPVPTPEELVGMFFKWVDLPHTRGFATLPYIKGLTNSVQNH